LLSSLTFSFFLFPFAFAARAAQPATQPATQIQKWFDELADRDPDVREKARDALMGMNASDLPRLRAVVQQSQPLAPSQAAELRDVVTHVYLAGETYPGDATKGFLGVKLSGIRTRIGPVAPQPPADDELVDAGFAAGPGVFVSERMPGFCGFRSLRFGDVVLGVVTREGLLRTRTQYELIPAVAATRPGGTLTLELLRQGLVIRVAIKLDVRPKAANDLNVIDEFTNERELKAEAYWRRNFALLVDGAIS
jgi:hypothetical protein